MTADLDTRCGELYACGDEVLPTGQPGGDRAAGRGGVSDGSAGDFVRASGFSASRERFELLVSFLDGADAAGLSHAELEERLDRDGRELLRRLFGDHLALRAAREQRVEQVIGDEGVRRAWVESGHARALETVFGTVSVERLAYRAPLVRNLHPADAALNLPIERHSHGLRKVAALGAPAAASTTRSTRSGGRPGSGWANARSRNSPGWPRWISRTSMRPGPPQGKTGDLLVLSADGKGIVMRPDALRTRAPARPRAGPAPKGLAR